MLTAYQDVVKMIIENSARWRPCYKRPTTDKWHVKSAQFLTILRDFDRRPTITDYFTGYAAIMAALLSRCGHYISVLFVSFSFFFFLLSFFHRLISAAADWMSTILLSTHGVALWRI